MPKADLAEYLSEERALLGQAFSTLRLEQRKTWNLACDRAATQGNRRPSLGPYGIAEIERLARRFGTQALYWTEC